MGFADFCDKELLHEAHESLKVGMELIGQSPTLLSQWHSEQRLWHFLAGMESGHDSPASKLPQCLRQYDAFVGQQNHASIAPDLSGSRGVGNGADDDHLQAAVHTNTLTAALCDWDVLSSNMEEHEDETKERQHQLEQQQWRLTQQECRIILQELQGVQLLVSADYRDYFENLNALLRERDELQERLQGAQLEQAKSQEELKTLRQGQEDLEQRLKEALAKQKNARDEHGQQMLELQAVCHENAMLKVFTCLFLQRAYIACVCVRAQVRVCLVVVLVVLHCCCSCVVLRHTHTETQWLSTTHTHNTCKYTCVCVCVCVCVIPHRISLPPSLSCSHTLFRFLPCFGISPSSISSLYLPTNWFMRHI